MPSVTPWPRSVRRSAGLRDGQVQSPYPCRCVALLLLLATSWASAADRCAEPDRAADVDRLFAKWDRLDSPGCAVGIVRNGELIYAKGFGTANLEDEAPNTPRTIFEIASASKSL